MSERINISSESHEEHNSVKQEKQAEHARKTIHESHPVKHEHKDKIDEIISKIEKSAKTSEELSTKRHEDKPDDEYRNINVGSQLRNQGLKQSLSKVQKELPRHQKAFSKFIHNSKVDKVSEATGATIGRPSGLLAAGTFSLVASIGVLTVCRYFGYEYNYLIGLASLGIGFIVGIMFEGLVKVFKRA